MPNPQTPSMEETASPAPNSAPAPAPAEHPAIAEVEAWFREHFAGPRLSQDLWNDFYKAKELLKARLSALL